MDDNMPEEIGLNIISRYGVNPKDLKYNARSKARANIKILPTRFQKICRNSLPEPLIMIILEYSKLTLAYKSVMLRCSGTARGARCQSIIMTAPSIPYLPRFRSNLKYSPHCKGCTQCTGCSKVFKIKRNSRYFVCHVCNSYKKRKSKYYIKNGVYIKKY